MSDGSFELQTAVYAALTAIAPPLVSGGIYSPAPQDTPLPYVEIDDSDTAASDVVGRSGVTETLNIHVWAEAQPPTETGLDGGYATVKKIISKIRDALHSKNLTVSGRSAAFAVVSSTRVFSDLDGASIHGVVTLTVNHFGQEES